MIKWLVNKKSESMQNQQQIHVQIILQVWFWPLYFLIWSNKSLTFQLNKFILVCPFTNNVNLSMTLVMSLDVGEQALTW